MLKLTTDATEGEFPEILQSLDELAREGARRMILAVLELGVEQYVQDLRHLFANWITPWWCATGTPVSAR